ncbi:MAG: PLP-dependent aminotransferase family protein [Mesorhizobium sp.]
MSRECATSIAWDNVFDSIAGAGGKPTHASLARGLSEWIDDGRLPGGARLPSTRTIAQKLGIGRNTVLFALANLIDNGYLDSKERSGIFVGLNRPVRTDDRAAVAPAMGPDWRRRLPWSHLTIPAAQASSRGNPGNISFRFGEFDLGLFPTSQWRECERAASGLREIARWGRDMVDGDDLGLIEQIRMHILPQCGIWARPDEILITVGAQEGRYLVARMLAQPGARIGIESPCSLDLLRTVQIAGAETIGLDVDENGVVPSDDMDNCDAVIVTPGHQNPTTVALAPERRQQILRRADVNDLIVVEDTFETEFLHERGGMPALKSEDRSGRVIYIGTLSRLMAPGLRIGFVVAPAVVVDHLRMLRRLIHRHPPANNQRSLAIFIERGYYRRFVRQTTRTLEERGAVLMAASRRHLPGFQWRHQLGTSCFWCEMPADVDAAALAHAARERGVIVEPGTGFFQTGDRAANCLRLTVSGVQDSQIEKGIRLLAEARLQVARSRTRPA